MKLAHPKGLHVNCCVLSTRGSAAGYDFMGTLTRRVRLSTAVSRRLAGAPQAMTDEETDETRVDLPS